jgi:hypothetical protein
VTASEAAVGKLRIGWVLGWVWRVYRRRWPLLIPLAVLVLLPQTIGDAAFGDLEVERIHSAADVLKLAAIPLSLVINLLGEALYAGIVAAAVVEWLAGRELTDIPRVARSIPYGRLIAIDLVLAFGTAIGLVLLLVPGVMFFTYMAASPALVELNDMPVKPALRKSVQLVRGSFWRVLGFSVVVLVISEGISALLESPVHGLHGEVLFNLAIEAMVLPFQGLTTVFLALALLDLHGEDRRLSEFTSRTGNGD